MIEYIKRVYICPDIHSQMDENRIHEALTSAPEIDTVEVDIAGHKVFVKIAGAENEGDIRRRLSNAGFPALDED